ncbi:MAG TPA: alpha/beta hydrolase-fold protein [Gaiellaceae bacterium]
MLLDNPLGDPHERPLWVWAPEDGARRYPSIYVLHSFGNSAAGWFDPEPGTASYPALIEQLAPEAIVVLVDASTALGGSQYIDSPGIGAYHRYLCDELVPFVDTTYPTIADAAHRGVQGKSSGGFGAIITTLLRPDLFGALATHAGDALFEVSHLPGFAPAARMLRDRHGGSFDTFRAAVASGRVSPSDDDERLLLELYALCAAYSSNDDGTIDLPFDLETAELRPDVWGRWLAWDPVLLARKPQHAATLRGLRGVWIDAGLTDEYHLDFGATAFHRAVVDAGVSADSVHFELFPGGHRGFTPRYPLSLAWLVERLSSTF